ncbi:MAG: sigma-70 family RNA polymerase sigma factor [Sedimentisphaerales bacterium]|nr:sigma-70 family RNA polymerase sigma factor [Sedimentisphaerales bacterium]
MQVINWQIIIEKHGPAVWQTAYRLLGNDTDAADCFQETFVSALKFSRRQRIRNFHGLLTRLATTRAIDQLRQRFQRSDCNVSRADWITVASNNPGPVQMAQKQELIDNLRQSLTELPLIEAQVFCMRYMNDMRYRQIAKELGIKTNAVGVLLHRARAKLRQSFEISAEEKDEVVL